MEYESIQDLPETLRDILPDRAQEIYLEAFQEAWDDYEDWQGGEMDRHSVAHERAMVEVKKEYVEDEETGVWHRKGEEPEEQDKDLVDQAKDTLGIE
jgi:cation transport regulator